jgi:hypothetical protein
MHTRSSSSDVRRLLMGAVGVGALLAGCGQDQQALDRAVAQFEAAVAGGDGATGCALLAPATRDALEHRAGAACPSTLPSLRLRGGDVVQAAQWGLEAQVHTSADTLFLTMTDQGWRVTAAGCSPRGDAPYACTVEGP